MSFRATNWAFETSLAGDHKAKLILIALANNADDEKFQCWPSVNYLAKRCEMGRSTVYRCIIHLSKLGLIHHEKRRNTIGVPRQPLFTLHVPSLVPIGDYIVPPLGHPNPTGGTSNEPSLNHHKERGKNLNSNKEGKKEERQEGFKALPASQEFQSWKKWTFETKQFALWRHLVQRENEGRGHNFETQWPPDHKGVSA